MERFEHPLQQYLRQRGIPQKDFADNIDISEPYLSLILDGQRRGPFELHGRIETQTGGAVTPAIMVDSYNKLKAARDKVPEPTP